MILASIPSPPQAVWHIGPFPLRAYAIAIIIGIVVAWWLFDRRYRAKGGPADTTIDISFWAVIFGIAGGRLYHVITDHQLYFGEGKNPIRALYVWEGGLGIWGAIALGGVGVWLGCHRMGLRLIPIADSLAPALLVAQAIGRIGNYFNQELYGAPTTLPWGLEIDEAHLVDGYPVGTLFHPTFLYELIWCLVGAAVLVALEKRFSLRGGQTFAAYVMIYTAGRLWIELLRVDSANTILGLRLNVWTSVIVFIGALIAFLLLTRRLNADPSWNDIWIDDEARESFAARWENDVVDNTEDEDSESEHAESDSEPDATSEKS